MGIAPKGGRRNLSPEAASLLRGKLYNAAKKGEGVRGPKKLYQNEPASTAEAIAKQTGVSPATVKRDAKFAAEVEKQGIESEVMAGRVARLLSVKVILNKPPLQIPPPPPIKLS